MIPSFDFGIWHRMYLFDGSPCIEIQILSILYIALGSTLAFQAQGMKMPTHLTKFHLPTLFGEGLNSS